MRQLIPLSEQHSAIDANFREDGFETSWHGNEKGMWLKLERDGEHVEWHKLHTSIEEVVGDSKVTPSNCPFCDRHVRWGVDEVHQMSGARLAHKSCAEDEHAKVHGVKVRLP